jgi:hypothetical protein
MRSDVTTSKFENFKVVLNSVTTNFKEIKLVVNSSRISFIRFSTNLTKHVHSSLKIITLSPGKL